MKTATVRDLRNHYTRLLAWLEAGEEIVITRRGKSIARLVPELGGSPSRVDWEKSPAVNRDRARQRKLKAREAAAVLKEASGRW